MTITDKTRKMLWGRSGNRCAMCKHVLVVDATSADEKSVVGDESHIVSGQVQGPRYNPTFSTDRLDEPDNLILLCRNHHKMVDDQCQTYTAEVLHSLKANHEKWVSSSLTEQNSLPPIRIRRIKENIPKFLIRLTSGHDVLTIVDRADAHQYGHDELKSEAEVDLVSGFLQEASDYGDLSSDIEVSDHVKASFEMTKQLELLHQAGFWVFGACEVRRMEGGFGSPRPFHISILQVLRADNPEIIKLDRDWVVEQCKEWPPDDPAAANDTSDV